MKHEEEEVSNVTDITGRLDKKRRTAEALRHYTSLMSDPRYTRLAEAAERQREEVLRDPIPHLERMGTLVAKLRQAIEEADHYLTGDGELLLTRSEDPPAPPKPYSLLLSERIERAREVLGTALEEK